MPVWNVKRDGPQWLCDKEDRVIGVRDRRGRDWLFAQQQSDPSSTEATSDPVPPGGAGTGANLSQTLSPTGILLASDSGTDVTLPLADGTNAGLMAPAQFSKLNSIESGATADMLPSEIVAAIDTALGGSGWQAGAGGSLVVQEGDTTVVSAAATLDLAAADFDVTETPAGEANVAISAAIARLASPAFTGTPTAPTAANGTNNTQLATTAFVQAAVALLLNSAPGALDTLDELAAALGDDANFAATMTNALALKANLASPGLTGTPTAPTAAGATDTTQIATTAYVRAEILSRVLTGLTAAGATAAPAAGDSGLTAWGKVLRLFNVLAGGSTGQVLLKNSATNFDWSWGAGGGSSAFPTVEAIATASPYTLVTGDANKIKVGNDTNPQTVNITTAFNGLGCWLQWNASAGAITLNAGTGVNLNGLGDGVDIVLSDAAGMVQIIPTGTNTWNVVGAIGNLAVADITDMSADARTFNQASNFANMRTALSAATRTQAGQFSFFIPTVADGDVVVIPMQAFAGTVTSVTTDCTSGTCTLTGKVNGTNFGGTANSVSTTKSTQAHASANTWATGDDLVFTASANSSCLGMRVTVTYNRVLA